MNFYSVQDYFHFQEEHRNSVLTSLSRRYHAIGPLLIKVEGLVVKTNTGKSMRLARYYEHWERKIFDSLVKVREVIDCIFSFIILSILRTDIKLLDRF